MAVGEILDGAFTTIRRYPRATLGLSAIVASFGAVVQLLLTLSLRDTTADGSFDGGALAAAAAGAIISILAGLVLTGMLTIVISEAVLGRPISLGAVWSRVTPRIGGILGAAILVSIVLAIGLVLCVLPGVYLYAGLAFTTPVLILEGASITAAMRRSRRLVNGSWWRVFGILVLASLIASVVGGVISVPFIGLSGGAKLFQVGAEPIHLGTGQLVLQAIGQIVSRTITAPITAGVTVLLYIDRRMRSEGLDVALAQAAAPPPASRGW
jgi:hypothetical protein